MASKEAAQGWKQGLLQRLIGRGRTLTADGPDPVAYAVTYMDAEPVRRPLVRVLITALGPHIVRREEQLEGIGAAVLQSGQQPILVGTDLSMRFLVGQLQPTEVMPLRTDLRVLTDAEYRSYIARRWHLLMAKWQITECIDLGQNLDAFVAGQLTTSV